MHHHNTPPGPPQATLEASDVHEHVVSGSSLKDEIQRSDPENLSTVSIGDIHVLTQFSGFPECSVSRSLILLYGYQAGPCDAMHDLWLQTGLF